MVNRIAPKLPVERMKTYGIRRPTATHTRPARCAEVNCQAQEKGWDTTVDEATPLGQRQAYYIRRQSGRRHTERRGPDGLTVFRFPPGEECFADHRVSLDRPELYLVHRGDWRGRVGDVRRHTGPDPWLNDFGEHQDQLARIINGKA